MQKYLALLVLCAAAVSASEYSDTELEDLDPRLFNNLLNSTANLIPISIGAVLTGLGSILVLILLGIGIWLLVTTLLFPKFDSNSGYGYDSYGGYGGGYGGGQSGGSSYSGYQASMYSKMFPVGIFVQMVFGAMMVKTSTQAGYISLGKPSLVKKQSFDYNLLPSSAHAFISAPSYIVPLSSLQKVDNTQSVDQQNFDSAAYSNAQQINPYISSYTSYAQIETTSESPRLFSNFANGLSSGGLFYCPPGDGSCLIQRVMGSIFVLAGLSVGGFLVYSLLTGGLGNVQDFGRSASPYATVFDKLSVLDWIAMMEEVYRKFDATSVDCQKRLVCELHQNENTWGSTARKMNDAFGYLQYFELLNLPEDLRMMLEEYLEAANKGRTSQNSCEELFPTCEFSMKSLISKYNGSNSI